MRWRVSRGRTLIHPPYAFLRCLSYTASAASSPRPGDAWRSRQVWTGAVVRPSAPKNTPRSCGSYTTTLPPLARERVGKPRSFNEQSAVHQPAVPRQIAGTDACFLEYLVGSLRHERRDDNGVRRAGRLSRFGQLGGEHPCRSRLEGRRRHFDHPLGRRGATSRPRTVCGCTPPPSRRWRSRPSTPRSRSPRVPPRGEHLVSSSWKTSRDAVAVKTSG